MDQQLPQHGPPATPAAHSPGPFRSEGPGTRRIVDATDRPVLIQMLSDRVFAPKFSGMAGLPCSIPWRHNLALFVAAPDVLARAERVVTLCTPGVAGAAESVHEFAEAVADLREACRRSRTPLYMPAGAQPAVA